MRGYWPLWPAVTQVITIFIFIISGLQLKRGEAAAALSAVGCVAWGLTSILLLTPLLGALPLLALPLPESARPLALVGEGEADAAGPCC